MKRKKIEEKTLVLTNKEYIELNIKKQELELLEKIINELNGIKWEINKIRDKVKG